MFWRPWLQSFLCAVSIRWPEMDICEPHRKHRFLYCCIYNVLHRNGSYPIVACVFVVAYCCRLHLATGCLPRISLRGNVFTELLPSNRSTCHNTNSSSHKAFSFRSIPYVWAGATIDLCIDLLFQELCWDSTFARDLKGILHLATSFI
jgi:hypothetical protein